MFVYAVVLPVLKASSRGFESARPRSSSPRLSGDLILTMCRLSPCRTAPEGSVLTKSSSQVRPEGGIKGPIPWKTLLYLLITFGLIRLFSVSLLSYFYSLFSFIYLHFVFLFAFFLSFFLDCFPSFSYFYSFFFLSLCFFRCHFFFQKRTLRSPVCMVIYVNKAAGFVMSQKPNAVAGCSVWRFSCKFISGVFNAGPPSE